jgi:cytochrome c biogenesis protein CcmG/thiol:disulfide interchange protein DsbE
MATSKRRKKNFPWPLLAFAVLTLSAGWIFLSRATAAPGTGSSAPQPGFLAPAFTLNTLDGRKVSLSDFKGNVVLINFWATWCPPCKAEMPYIQAAYATYRDQGLVVLAIDSTSDQDEARAAGQFASANGLAFPVLADVRGEASQLYQVQALPTSFFMDRQGKIAWVVVGGPMAEALIRSHIETLLKANP